MNARVRRGRQGQRAKVSLSVIVVLTLIATSGSLGLVKADPSVICICPTCNPYGEHCGGGGGYYPYTVTFFAFNSSGTVTFNNNLTLSIEVK